MFPLLDLKADIDIMQVKMHSIYYFSHLVWNLDILQQEGKDAWIAFAKENESDIFSPKITPDGLRHRQLASLVVPIVWGILAMFLAFIGVVLGIAFKGASLPLEIVMSASLLLFAAGAYISLVRSGRGALDELKLRWMIKNGRDTSNFVPTKKIFVRWYDFIFTAMFTILPLMSLGFFGLDLYSIDRAIEWLVQLRKA